MSEREKMRGGMTRREFSVALGGGLAAAGTATSLAGASATEAAAGAEGVAATHEERRRAARAALQNYHASAGAKELAPGTIRINFNENPYGPTPKAVAALDACGRAAGRYTDHAEHELTETLAGMHGVKAENVMLGCGSIEVLHVADLVFLGPGKNVVAAEPTFEAVLGYAQVLQANAVKVPLTADYRHDLPRMAAACTSKTGVVYVCNPNNPTGTVVTRKEMAEFLAQVPPETLVVVDEAYHHFVEEPGYATSVEFIGAYPNMMVARTFSKIYGLAGMRLGYAVGSKENIERMKAELLIANANAGVLAAAAASLKDQEALGATRAKLVGTRTWLCGELKKDGRAYIPSQANFMMIDMGGDAKPYIAKFEEKKILVGRPFGAMPNYMRVTIGTQEEMVAFVRTLREIAPVKA